MRNFPRNPLSVIISAGSKYKPRGEIFSAESDSKLTKLPLEIFMPGVITN